MKVTSITCHLLSSQWTGDPSFPHDMHATALVQLETDEGISGLGEISLAYFAPETTAALVDYFTPVLIDRDPMQITRLTRAMESDAVWWSRSGAGRSVIGGLEMALWDLAGKALGVPVYQLLGGAVREAIPVYASGGPTCWPVEQNIEKLEFYRELGYRAAKLSTSFYASAATSTGQSRRVEPVRLPHAAKLKRIAENFERLRSHFGDDFDLAIDGHEGGVPDPIAVQEAIEISHAVAPYRLVFYEEPLPYGDVAGYCELRSRSRVPIAGGESLSGVDQFHPFIAGRGVHLVQPDLGYVGGIGETVKIAHHAAAHGISAAIHTGGCIGPAMAASWHVAAALPSVEWLEVVVAARHAQDDLLLEPIAPRDGEVGLPSGPGLGVRLDRDLLEKYCFVPGSGERT
ncbi:MAG: mandelate racemase/muconate lactonizing enzyme family protein [Pirellulales bacterium]|nr:mandelate racemase/muconate lactonizing enzyme family protein [Pirellulales bacterium]